MKQWFKGIALFLAVLLFCSAVGGSAPALKLPGPAPTGPVLSTPPTKPTEPPTQPPTQMTEPPTAPPTQPPVTEPVTEATQPPTEVTQPPVTQPVLTDPPASEAITVGNYIPGITAKKAFVYDYDSRSYLYMKGEADAKLYPASITKLMNAYTALKILDLDALVTMGRDIYDITPKDTSLAGIYAGNQMTVRTALQAMLIPSGSDAAHLVAVSAGRVLAKDPNLEAQAAENLFVEEMNRQAALLGLVNTHFVHADGYHDYYHYTCMADLVIIAAVCLDTPFIRDTVKSASMTLTLTNNPETATLSTTNLMLKPSNPHYYHPETRGMKTGTTEAAGSCLLGAFWVNDRYVLVGVFQCATNNARYNNANALFHAFCPSTPVVPPPTPDDTTQTTDSAVTTETTQATETTQTTQIPADTTQTT